MSDKAEEGWTHKPIKLRIGEDTANMGHWKPLECFLISVCGKRQLLGGPEHWGENQSPGSNMVRD